MKCEEVTEREKRESRRPSGELDGYMEKTGLMDFVPRSLTEREG